MTPPSRREPVQPFTVEPIDGSGWAYLMFLGEVVMTGAQGIMERKRDRLNRKAIAAARGGDSPICTAP